jgi:hypothetical protein
MKFSLLSPERVHEIILTVLVKFDISDDMKQQLLPVIIQCLAAEELKHSITIGFNSIDKLTTLSRILEMVLNDIMLELRTLKLAHHNN